MQTQKHFMAAYAQTAQNGQTAVALLDPAKRPGYVDAYLNSLEDTFSDAEAPTDASVADEFAYAIFNTQAPLEERRELLNSAVELLKVKLLDSSVAKIGQLDGEAVRRQADSYSSQFVERMISFADDQTGVSKTDGMENFKRNMAFLYPEQQTPETKAIASLTMFGVLQPYLVDRLLELDVYNPKVLKTQITQIRNDCMLMAGFGKSVSAFLEFTTTGKRAHSDAEIADQLFGIGPIFAQLGQSFSEGATNVDDDVETRKLVGAIGRAFQEGIAMPDATQQKELEASLPAGLRLKEIFSSAKIAYVAKTKAGDQEFATKIKRPGVEAALAGNVRIFTVMTDIMQRYIETHTGDSLLAERYGTVKDALPFVLSMLERDMLVEMDFENEARLQKHGAQVLARHDGLVVPFVYSEHSDASHITMDLVPSKRIEDLPADANYLKNVMILVLEGRRRKFLHGDMHGGNIKALEDDPLGRLVAFDWGKSIELPKGFEKNVFSLVIASMRKNPKAMAKAFQKVQHPDDQHASETDLEQAAQDAITEVIESTLQRKQDRQAEKSRAGRKLQETADIITNFSVLVAKRHQSGLDVRYITYMKSMTSLATIMKAELAKPEYEGKAYRTATILKSAALAVREVYKSTAR